MPRFEMRSSTAMAGVGSATPLPDAASATPVVPHGNLGERESASGLVASPNSNNSKEEVESCPGSSGNTTEHSDFVEFATEFRHLRLPPQQGGRLPAVVGAGDGGARLPQETQDLRNGTATTSPKQQHPPRGAPDHGDLINGAVTQQTSTKREDETPCSPHARDGSRAAGSMGGQSSPTVEQTREPRRAPFLRQEVQQDTEASTTAALRDEIRVLAEARTRLLDHANNLEDRFGAAILSLARDADLDVEQVKDRFGKLGLRVDERGRADWNKVSRAAQEITGVPGGSVDTALELLTTQTALAEHADLQILARECNAIVDDHFRNERLSGGEPRSGGIIGGTTSRSITQLTSLIRSVFDELRQPGSGAEAADHRQIHDQELRREVATQKALREDERRRYNLKEDAWKREIGEMGEMLAILSQTEKELVALLEAEDAEFDDEEGGGASQRGSSTADAGGRGAVDKGPPRGAEDGRDHDDEDASRATAAVEVEDGKDPASSGTAASPVSRPRRDSGKKSQKKSDGLRESVAEHEERLAQLRNSASKLLRTPPLVRKRLQTRTPSSLLVHEAEETKGEQKLQLDGGPTTHLQRTPQEKLDELAEKAPRFLQMSLEYADKVISDLERRCERDGKKDDDCARCLASVRELKAKFDTDLKDKLLQWLFLSMQQNQNGSPAAGAPYNDVDGGASGGSSPGLVRIATPAKFSEAWLRDLHEVLSRAKDIHADVATFRIVRELNDNKFLELERARAMRAGDLEAQKQAWQHRLKEKVLEVETYYDQELSKMEEVLAKSKAEAKKREDQLRKLTEQTQLAGDAEMGMRLAEMGSEMENMRGKHAEEMEELRRNLSAISAAALDGRDERIAALEAENDRLNRANRGFAPLHDNLRKTIDDLKSELTGQLSDTSNDVEVLEQMLLDHEKQLEQWRQQIEDKDPTAEEEMPAPSQHSRGVSAGGGSKSSAFRPTSRGSSVANMHGAPAPTTRAKGGSKEDMTPNNSRGRRTAGRRESSPDFNENNVRTFLRDNKRPLSRVSVSGEREATPAGGSFDKFIEKLEDSVAAEVVAAEVGAPLVPGGRMKSLPREDSQVWQQSTHANPPPRPKSSNTTGAHNKKSSLFRESERFSFPVFLNENDYENVALAQGPPRIVQPQTQQFSHRQETEAPSLRVPRPRPTGSSEAYVEPSGVGRRENRATAPAVYYHPNRNSVTEEQPRITDPPTAQRQVQAQHTGDVPSMSRIPRARATSPPGASAEWSDDERPEKRATAPVEYYHPNSATEEQARMMDPETAQRQVQEPQTREALSMSIPPRADPRARATSPPEAFFEPVPDEEGPVTTTTAAVHHDLDSLAEGRQTSIKRLPPRVDEVRHRVLERVKASLARASAGTADAGLASTPTPDPAPTSTAPVVAGIERSGGDSTSSHQSKRLQQLVRANYMQRGRTTVPAGETAPSPGTAVATSAAAVADADEEAPGSRKSAKEVSLSTRSGGRLVELDTPVVMESVRTRSAVVAVPRPDDTHFPTAWQIVKRHTATSQNTATSQDDNDYRL